MKKWNARKMRGDNVDLRNKRKLALTANEIEKKKSRKKWEIKTIKRRDNAMRSIFMIITLLEANFLLPRGRRAREW